MNAHQAKFAQQKKRIKMPPKITDGNNPVINLATRSQEMAQRHWLVDHCKGDSTAFPKLIQLLRKPIYSYLVRCGVGFGSRDDLFQDIFLKIHLAAANYQASRPLKPWVFTIAANTVRNYFRAENARRTLPWQPIHETQADNTPGVEQIAAAQATVTWLDKQLVQLPLAQREVLILCSIEGLPLKDTAHVLQIPLNTVKTHLRRARLALLKAKAEREQGQQQGQQQEEVVI